MDKIKLLKRFVTPLFYAVVIAFFAYYFENIDFYKIKNIDINYFSLTFGIFVYLLMRFWLSFTWGNILKMLGVEKTSFIELNYVYAKSWLGRYIPGKVAWILGKIYFASQLGISKTKLGISSVLEAGVQVCVALLLGIGLIYLDGSHLLSNQMKAFMGLATLGMLIVLFPPIFNKLILVAYKILKKSELTSTGYDSLSLIKMTGYFIVSGLISGVSFFFIINAFWNLEAEQLGFVIGTSNLAGAIGIIAIISPSGIGVREGVQLVLLQSILPDEVLIVVLIIGRLASILADFLFYGFSFLMNRLK